MNKVLLFFAVIFLAARPAFTQNENDGLVKWLDFKEAQEKNKKLQKPFLIDIYTDWCGWCKHMIKTTYSSPGMADYINTNFYPVKFNAETKDTIEYNGKTYKPLSKDPKAPHELAVKFLGSSLSYPSTVFITNNFEYTLLTQGFLEEKKMEPILIFMLENGWRTAVFDEFSRHFSHTFYDTNYVKIPVKVYSIAEVEKLQKKNPKKVLVTLNASFCNSCRVMDRTTFSDTSIANYINEKFYLVNFNTESNDTILFKNEKHFKSKIPSFPLHSLSVQLTGNRFSLPALCLLDEELTTIDVLNYYQSPEHLKPILSYIGENNYKTTSFPEYMKTYNNASLKTQKKTIPAKTKKK